MKLQPPSLQKQKAFTVLLCAAMGLALSQSALAERSAQNVCRVGRRWRVWNNCLQPKNHHVMNKIICVLIFAIVSQSVWATTYYSSGNADPKSVNSWWTVNNGTGTGVARSPCPRFIRQDTGGFSANLIRTHPRTCACFEKHLHFCQQSKNRTFIGVDS